MDKKASHLLSVPLNITRLHPPLHSHLVTHTPSYTYTYSRIHLHKILTQKHTHTQTYTHVHTYIHHSHLHTAFIHLYSRTQHTYTHRCVCVEAHNGANYRNGSAQWKSATSTPPVTESEAHSAAGRLSHSRGRGGHHSWRCFLHAPSVYPPPFDAPKLLLCFNL